MIPVACLDEGKSYWFTARTSYEALQKMKYTLDLTRKDPEAKINKTESGLHLYMEHGGRTYSVKNW